ncbi:hypothetical protein F4780DRAFT_108596 [Xylariomycetidae sp. FL0641]|nr:hypothetical protein F4780DRAFT_108596 [Xylariomycetidae sp. FL0641]
MVEVLRSPSLGHRMSSPSDMMEVASRFNNHLNLRTIEEEEQQQRNGSNSNSNTNTNTNTNTGEGKMENRSGNHRVPRRAFTSTEHQIQGAPVSRAIQTQKRLLTPTPSARGDAAEVDSYFQLQNQNANTATTSNPSAPTTSSQHLSPAAAAAAAASPQPTGRTPGAVQRPPMPSPQRSYSVMDFEPVPFTHQPGTVLTLPNLPPEIHYAIFDFLDPIDSVCLGLTSRHFYAVYTSMHGRAATSLAARREGPNDMEWVWRNAGPFEAPSAKGGSADAANNNADVGKQNSLALLTPRGQVYCRKCRTQRCELHNHIKEWMGDGREYCAVTQKFGAAAHDGAKSFCHRSSPRHPHRCGRHTRQQRAVRLV